MDHSIIDALADAARKVYDDTRPAGTTLDFGASRRPLNRDHLGKAIAVYDYAMSVDTNAAMDAEPSELDTLRELATLAYDLAGGLRKAHSEGFDPTVAERIFRAEQAYDQYVAGTPR